MTLRRFIDVSFVLLVEMFQQHNMTMLDAIEKVTALGGDPPEQKHEAERIDNAASMQQMMSLMGGVKGAPV